MQLACVPEVTNETRIFINPELWDYQRVGGYKCTIYSCTYRAHYDSGNLMIPMISMWRFDCRLPLPPIRHNFFFFWFIYDCLKWRFFKNFWVLYSHQIKGNSKERETIFKIWPKFDATEEKKNHSFGQIRVYLLFKHFRLHFS